MFPTCGGDVSLQIFGYVNTTPSSSDMCECDSSTSTGPTLTQVEAIYKLGEIIDAEIVRARVVQCPPDFERIIPGKEYAKLRELLFFFFRKNRDITTELFKILQFHQRDQFEFPTRNPREQ